MSNLPIQHKLTTRALPALAVITFFVALATCTLGGGYRSGPQVNDDPRSVALEVLIVDRPDPDAPAQRLFSAPGSTGENAPTLDPVLTTQAFDSLVARATQIRTAQGVRVRTPTLLIQHNETAECKAALGKDTLTLSLTPTVLKNDVIRLAIDHTESVGDCSRAVSTAMTLTPGAALVLHDLTGPAPDSGSTTIAIRARLIEP